MKKNWRYAKCYFKGTEPMNVNFPCTDVQMKYLYDLSVIFSL